MSTEPEARIESGVIQFGDDWPGLFLRGKNAFFYGIQVRRALELLIAVGFEDELGGRILLGALRDLFAELQACDVSKGLPVTRLRPAKECLP